jgi:Uma2 family endonuclease
MASVTPPNTWLPELSPETLAQMRAELRETDDEPLETPWHRSEINLLIDLVDVHRAGREDYYVGGNMFIYYSMEQARSWKYRGPDFFFVEGTDRRRERLYWWILEEKGKFPNVIIELTSPSTAREDHTIKKDLYEQTFRTPEYYCYDPFKHRLEGWRLDAEGRYRDIPTDARGWMWSEQLGLWLGKWQGIFQGQDTTWLRFYDAEGNLVPMLAEQERRYAEAERQRAEAERQRADALAVEVEILKKRLAREVKHESP